MRLLDRRRDSNAFFLLFVLVGAIVFFTIQSPYFFDDRNAFNIGRAFGIAPFCPIFDLNEATWDETFDTNVKGYLLFAQAVARQMIAQGQGGSLVNVTSVSAHESGEHKAYYCASKAAVGSLTKGLALELARYGIRVNAVEPGTVDTLIVKDAYLAGLMESLIENPGTPINRLAGGYDMVGAVMFLCSEAPNLMTGSSILVDGGGFAGSQLPDAVLREYQKARTDRIK